MTEAKGKPIVNPHHAFVVKEAYKGQAKRTTVLKATVVGDKPGSDAWSRAMAETDENNLPFQTAGALDPPYDFNSLCFLLEHSSALKQCVEAYATNIDGFGHHWEPTINLDGEEAKQQVRDLMEQGIVPGGDNPTDEQINTQIKTMHKEARKEYLFLRNLFEGFTATDGYSFTKLRRITREDKETTGGAYWEVLRNKAGQVSRLVYVPSHTMRLMPLNGPFVPITRKQKTGPLTYEDVTTRKRFRHFAQTTGTKVVYFKEFGDPRTVSMRTGKVINTEEEREQMIQEGDAPATEIIYWNIHSSRTPYGVPRWIGALLSVLGSRSAEEVNLAYFDNKSVPPLALLVSNGRLADNAVERLENYIDREIKGQENFHKILIIEAEEQGTAETGKLKLELKPLTEAQYKEELFSKYDERNIDKVGQAFRLPPILRGETPASLNRATAQASIRFAEEQVFEPERNDFDFVINHKLLSEYEVKYWTFVSNSPVTRDPERMTVMVEKLVKAGVLLPNEGRVLASDIFNRQYNKVDQDWGNMSLPFALAGYRPESLDTTAEEMRANNNSSSNNAEAIGEGDPKLSAIRALRQETQRLHLLHRYVTDALEETESKLADVDSADFLLPSLESNDDEEMEE